MRYIPELDGLRALAVLAVLLFHSAPHGPFPGGFVGVDLFFVLSAFLITGLLEQQDLRTFYMGRYLRLTPALLFMLCGYLLVAPLLWPGYPHARDAGLAALYVSDYSFTFWGEPHYLRHTWSLAVEEQFYLLWPFALMLLNRAARPQRWLIGAYAVLTLWRLPFAADWASYYYRFDTHATGLIAGAWLYFDRPKFSRWHAAVAGAVLAAILVCGRIDEALLFITPAEIASAVLIGWAAQQGAFWLRSAPLRVIGKLSYGIYLWHLR
jgi:peptidoglycan/LPS O-acetylase OafA/YrhL